MLRPPALLLCLLLLRSAAPAQAAENVWNTQALFQAPRTFPTAEYAAPGVEALFFEGLPWQGNPTRVFAYIGLPAQPAGAKAPGIVLVHGGGGTAFPEWVRLWTSRGYAAIAMDTCGCVPGRQLKQRPRHRFGGPPGWGGWDQTDQPPEDQWTFHAVADVLLAHSLLRSRAGVDPDRIGLTGISWGGYLACIAAGVDDRLRFAAPVYGCGFLGENSAWLGEFARLGPAKSRAWLERWDPSVYLPSAKIPMLWVDGTNDFAYPLDSLQKSYRLPSGPRTLCVRVRMPHGHGGPGENPAEIGAFADQILKGGPALARLSAPTVESGMLKAGYESPVPVAKAELNFTRDAGVWQKRLWETAPAELLAGQHAVQAPIPAGAHVAYLNITDERGLVTSTEHVEFREGTVAPDKQH